MKELPMSPAGKGVLWFVVLMGLQWCLMCPFVDRASNTTQGVIMLGAICLSVAAGIFIERTETLAARKRKADADQGAGHDR